MELPFLMPCESHTNNNSLFRLVLIMSPLPFEKLLQIGRVAETEGAVIARLLCMMLLIGKIIAICHLRSSLNPSSWSWLNTVHPRGGLVPTPILTNLT